MTYIVLLTGLLSLFVSVSIQAQTTVDLKTQSRNVDFSSAESTRPTKTGTVLPAACQTGDLFFKTNSSAGQNLYGCTATNTWTPQSGAARAAQLADFAVGKTSGTVVSIGSSCSALLPCNVRYGNTIYPIPSSTATITAGSGNGYAKVFISQAGAIVVQHTTAAGLSITCSACTASQVTTPAFPANSIPIADVTIASGQWDTLTDQRAFVSSKPITAGTGISITDSLGETLIAIDTADVMRLSGANVALGSYDFTGATITGISGGWTAAAGTFDMCAFGICSGAASDTWFARAGKRVYYRTVIIPGTVIAFKSYVIRVGSAGSGNGALALMDSSCNKVANTDANFSATANGYVVAHTTVPVTLPAGIYYLGFAVESETAVVYGDPNTTTNKEYLSRGTMPALFTSATAGTGSAGTFALPSTCGTKNNGAASMSLAIAFPSVHLVN